MLRQLSHFSDKNYFQMIVVSYEIQTTEIEITLKIKIKLCPLNRVEIQFDFFFFRR